MKYANKNSCAATLLKHFFQRFSHKKIFDKQKDRPSFQKENEFEKTF